MIVVLCGLLQLTAGYKMLFLVPFNGKSHWILLERLIEALLDRDHHVTAITNFKWNGPKPQNYTEILIDPPLDFEKESENDPILNSRFITSRFLIFHSIFRATKASFRAG